MNTLQELPDPEYQAAQLAPMFLQRKNRWLPAAYFDIGMELKELLDATERERFDYNGKYLKRVGKILKKECGVGTPTLRWAVRLVKTINEQDLEFFRKRKVTWTTLRLVLRALTSNLKDPVGRLALIRQWFRDYKPAKAIQKIRALIPSERVRKLKKGEKAFVVVTSQNRLRGKYLLNKEDALRVAHRYMKKGVRIMPVVRYGLT